MFEYIITLACFLIFLHSLGNYDEIKLLKRRVTELEDFNEKLLGTENNE